MFPRASAFSLKLLYSPHRRSQRGGGAEGPSPLPPANIKASLVNMTLNMRYKNDQKYQICHHQTRFSKLKMLQNPFSAGALPRTPLGELTTLPQTPQSAGEEDTLAHSPPRSTPSASRTPRLGSQAPSTQNPGYASAYCIPYRRLFAVYSAVHIDI